MAKTSKSNDSLWHGYLNAGDRSSPVLRDTRLDTGNPKTLYLFNLARGEILEYACEIVERKLRDLKPAESGLIAELNAAYKKARRNFKGRSASIRNIPERGGPAPQQEKKPKADKNIAEIIGQEADMWLDTEEA